MADLGSKLRAGMVFWKEKVVPTAIPCVLFSICGFRGVLGRKIASLAYDFVKVSIFPPSIWLWLRIGVKIEWQRARK